MVADRLLELRPVPAELLDAIERTAWERVDAGLLDLVRMRIGMLLGHPLAATRSPWVDADRLPQGRIDALADWPTSDLFDARDRDCLAFAEQFVMDVAGVSDELAADASRHFGPGGFYAFVNAVWVMDLGQRLDLACAALFPAGAPR